MQCWFKLIDSAKMIKYGYSADLLLVTYTNFSLIFYWIYVLSMLHVKKFPFCLFRYSHVFTADSGNSLGELIGHSADVNNISFRPERPFRLVSASEDNSLCFYEGPPFKFKVALKVKNSVCIAQTIRLWKWSRYR